MACTDVQTIQAGNGSKTQFSFDFPYIFKSEIHVYFWNVTTKEYDEVLTTDATYPWSITPANPTIVEFSSTAPPSPSAPTDPNEPTVDNVKIRRITNLDDIRALFNPGSAIRSNDLNQNFEQLRYAIQESNCTGIPDDVDDYLKTYYWNNFDDTLYSGDSWVSNDAKIASTAALDAETELKFDTLVQTATPSGSYRTGKTWLQNDDELTLSVWNGSAWTGVVSGGTFTNQPKVVYVDASSGDDNNDGHRISRPKLTIKAAVAQINADATFGDGSVVVVAPGTYQEACPIDIEKSNVSIVGTALRSCIVHPTVATEENVMFRVNSGTFLQNLTFTGMKASGALGNSADPALPVNQGWNIAFFPGCTIVKSPYIQNCTNFSDSEIDNSAINVITPGGGLGGDNDSAPTGGGVLIDGAVPAVTSPLRSMVCDSYTHVGLNGPGLLVTNNGYTQCTSSYAFFNKYHIKCLNGGQANLAASTTDFGDQALVADGKSTTAIFTSNVDGIASNGDISFNINQPVAAAGWHGDTQRPATNMLVTVNSITYPILAAVANTDTEGGNGWTVTISRPDPTNRSNNLGLNGALADNLAVSFFLRSQIASSGHTMEYVGSGTDYRALPENGGTPDDTKQKTELNDGKIWTATTDHNGKFTIGGNQSDSPFFQVDQQLGFVTIPEGSFAFNLLSDSNPQLGADLDVNGNEITSASNGNVVINPNGTGNVVLNSDVSFSQEASSSPYPEQKLKWSNDSTTANGFYISQGTDRNGKIWHEQGLDIQFATNNTERLRIDSSGNIKLNGDSPFLYLSDNDNNWIRGSSGLNQIRFGTNGSERLRIDSSGNLGIGTSSPEYIFDTRGSINISGSIFRRSADNTTFSITNRAAQPLTFGTNDTERMRIDSSGNVLIGASSVSNITGFSQLVLNNSTGGLIEFQDSGSNVGRVVSTTSSMTIRTNGELVFDTNGSDERMRIDTSGKIRAVGTSSTARIVPDVDNVGYLGESGQRWQAVYAVNGTIQTSDSRLKTEIAESNLGYEFIKSLRPVSYKWIDGGDNLSRNEEGELVHTDVSGRRNHYGFIAQEVKEALGSTDFGGWVIGDVDDTESIQSLRYDQFIAPLTKALQEAMERIETLEAKVAALEG